MFSLELDTIGFITQWTVEFIQPVVNAILAGSMALLKGAYQNMRLRRRLLNAGICALLALTVRDLLSLMGLELRWANVASVLIGFLGADYLSDLIKKLIGKKTGFKNDK
jgi:lambda family phage holin